MTEKLSRLANAVFDAVETFRSACIASGRFPSPPTWWKNPATGRYVVFMTEEQFCRAKALEEEAAAKEKRERLAQAMVRP
ncbi:MAG: hypothetical protein Q8P41_31685 [Pseudomonadota bacterium]|nr:hypothetical protein [Pseudomonadota bacterium]